MELNAANKFGWVDYLVFALTLAISAAIGMYYAFTGKRQRSTKEIFVGGRKMTLLPVTLSIFASFMSAVAVLGTPAEIYSNGIVYVYLGISYLIAFPCAAHVFLPMFYRLDCVSAHEYLSMRFGETVRIAASATFVLQMVTYMAVVLYAPALAFSQVSGLSMWLSIFAVGLVCSAYTALGGIKAVMWTDCFQAVLMFCGLATVIVRGTIEVGGLGAVLSAAQRGGRLNWFYLRYHDTTGNASSAGTVRNVYETIFSPNPLERHTLWTLVIGGAFMCGTIYSGNQAQIQRYLACRSLGTAQKALWINIPVTWVMLTMFGLCGLVAYAVYENCDPLAAGLISKKDQIIPYFVMDKMNVPGIPGIFLACVLSAALSTVSSGLNSLATVSMVDIVLPIAKAVRTRRQRTSDASAKPAFLTDSRVAQLSKVLAMAFGMLTIGLAFAMQPVGQMVLPIALSIFGILGGPLLGLFVTGMFFPFVNSHGALAGLITSLIASCWISIGAIVTQPKPAAPRIPDCVANLTAYTYTSLYSSDWAAANVSMSTTSIGLEQALTAFTSMPNNTSSTGLKAAAEAATSVYRISYLYYGAVAVLVCIITSSIVSLFTGLNRKRPVDSRLYYPMFAKLCICIPSRQRSACCGDAMHISYDASTLASTETHNDNDATKYMETEGIGGKEGEVPSSQHSRHLLDDVDNEKVKSTDAIMSMDL